MSGPSVTLRRIGRSRAGGAPARNTTGNSPERPTAAPPLGIALLACVAAAGLSLLLPSTPSYDPWAWIVWGREVAGLALDTRFGPSWKPLPVLFTTPFSVFGEAAPQLWLVVARAGALVGLVAAFRLGRRLGGLLAGALAVLTLALASGYLRAAALGYSEGLLVAFVLLAVERHLEGRRGQALALGFAAGLLRPEVWPFLGLYGLWVFVREPRLRAWCVAVAVVLAVLWFGPELWGSGDALRAASRAQDPTLFSPAFAAHPALAVLGRAAAMIPWPAKAGSLLAVAIALAALLSSRAGREGAGRTADPGCEDGARSDGGRGAARHALVLRSVADAAAARATLALAAAGIAWLALVAVMTEFGYAGNMRYLILPVGLCCAVGGTGLGWLARGAARVLRGGNEPSDRTSGGRGLRAAALASAPALVVCVACLAFLAGPLAEVTGDAGEVRYEARLNAALPTAVARAGGRERVLECGTPYATALQVTPVAWYLGVPTGRVGVEPKAPGVFFRGPPFLQPPDARAPAVDAGGLRPIARVGDWTVSSSC